MNSQPIVSADKDSIKDCIVCQRPIITYAFQIAGKNFFQCDNCRTIAPEHDIPSAKKRLTAIKHITHRNPVALKRLILSTLEDRSACGQHLVISTMGESHLVEKIKQHLPVETTYVDIADVTAISEKKFGTIILLVPLSMIPKLDDFFHSLRSLLKQDGHLLFLQPMLDSSQAKLMGCSWLEWNQPNAFYLTRETLHMLILKQGFDRVWLRKARYLYTLKYLYHRLKTSHAGALHHCLASILFLVPPFLRSIKLRLPSSHVIVSCQLAISTVKPTLSIVLPVYNEKNTFEDLMQALLAKTIEGIRKQIIIVESNSTDGTRDLVKKYADHPDVQVIWQECARGKGFAVREGLAAASGDYVLIQDADLEYDVNDYDSLLVPLRANQAMFVLGSRHTGSWRIREFNDAVATATVFNIGHIFFTWFVNLLTRQKMTDPFTMFKVFRRDALFGLNFICKRFDFDHEMVIKLVRKGYQPLELPVNYRARSFAEGKKVSFVKDGLTWVYTDLKLRFGKLGRWPN